MPMVKAPMTTITSRGARVGVETAVSPRAIDATRGTNWAAVVFLMDCADEVGEIVLSCLKAIRANVPGLSILPLIVLTDAVLGTIVHTVSSYRAMKYA